MVFCKKSDEFVFYPAIFHYICHAIDKTAHDLSDDPVQAEELAISKLKKV